MPNHYTSANDTTTFPIQHDVRSDQTTVSRNESLRRQKWQTRNVQSRYFPSVHIPKREVAESALASSTTQTTACFPSSYQSCLPHVLHDQRLSQNVQYSQPTSSSVCLRKLATAKYSLSLHPVHTNPRPIWTLCHLVGQRIHRGANLDICFARSLNRLVRLAYPHYN